jgi:hypothetical protein
MLRRICRIVMLTGDDNRLIPMNQMTPTSPLRKFKAQRLDVIQLNQYGPSLCGHLKQLLTKKSQCGGGAATIVCECSKLHNTFALSHVTLLVNIDILLAHLHAKRSRKRRRSDPHQATLYLIR